MKKNIIILFLSLGFYYLEAQSLSNLFGFATSNTFTYFDIKDTSFIYKAERISPNVLRFPGGAVGNFYHYNKAGYGLDLAEITHWHKGGFPKRAKGLLRSVEKKKHNENYIEDFIKMAKLTNSSVVLVANIITGSPEETILMIEHMERENLEVIGVELGSELSNRPYYLAGFDKNDYIRLAKLFSKEIKEKYPDLKTAVVAAPIVLGKKHRHTIWNEELAKLDFYDAVILHSYAKVTKGKDQYGEMIKEVPEGATKKEAFFIYKQRVLSYFSKDYPKEIQKYEKIFNKPFWITEWNLQISRITGNTLLQGLFVANYFLTVAANKSLSNIKITTFHNLGGRDVSGSVFMNQNDTMITHSTYIPLSMLAKIFDVKNGRITEEKINKEIYKYVVFDEKNKIRYICLLNWSSKNAIIDISVSNSVKIQTYRSDELFDQPKADGKLLSENYLLSTSSASLDRSINTSHYSLTLVELLND